MGTRSRCATSRKVIYLFTLHCLQTVCVCVYLSCCHSLGPYSFYIVPILSGLAGIFVLRCHHALCCAISCMVSACPVLCYKFHGVSMPCVLL
jgi:hypothetical protein